jgi:hypothetical protein
MWVEEGSGGVDTPGAGQPIWIERFEEESEKLTGVEVLVEVFAAAEKRKRLWRGGKAGGTWREGKED